MSAQIIEFPPSAVVRSGAEREYLEQCLAATRHRAVDEMEAWDNAVRVCAASWEIVRRKDASDAGARL